MSWVCNYCIPSPHPLQLISYSFTLYYCQGILLSKSFPYHFTQGHGVIYDRAEMNTCLGPPHPTTPGNVQINRWGGKEGLSCTPIYSETTRTQRTQPMETSILKPKFYWQTAKCALSKFRTCLSL